MNNYLKQGLNGLWMKALHGSNNICRFEEVVGHNDIKQIL
jgi:hypothetical protein